MCIGISIRCLYLPKPALLYRSRRSMVSMQERIRRSCICMCMLGKTAVLFCMKMTIPPIGIRTENA